MIDRMSSFDLQRSLERGGRKSLFDAQVCANEAEWERLRREKMGATRFDESELEVSSVVGKFVMSHNFEILSGIMVLINFAIMTADTHARATADAETVIICQWLNRVLLLWYIFECAARMCVLRWKYFLRTWNNVDLVLVVIGVGSEIIEFVVRDDTNLKNVSVFKSFRLMRMLRLVKLFCAFRELYVLIAGITRCIKTLFWASTLIFLSLAIWAIISVEYLQPYVDEMALQSKYTSCNWCSDAFANVWNACVTWFSIIAGDGWEPVGMVIAQHNYLAFVLFVCCTIFIVMGLMNLIVAALVDAATVAREEDYMQAAKFKELSETNARRMFESLFDEIDADANGEVSVEEFRASLQTCAELAAQLKLMGIEKHEVEFLVELFDANHDGRMSRAEFTTAFFEMRTHNVNTTLYYVLQLVQKNHSLLSNTIHRTLKEQTRILKDLRTRQDFLASQISLPSNQLVVDRSAKTPNDEPCHVADISLQMPITAWEALSSNAFASMHRGGVDAKLTSVVREDCGFPSPEKSQNDRRGLVQNYVPDELGCSKSKKDSSWEALSSNLLVSMRHDGVDSKIISAHQEDCTSPLPEKRQNDGQAVALSGGPPQLGCSKSKKKLPSIYFSQPAKPHSPSDS
eukprot:TRINITY_DN38231_c0_g1_i1.p1 TRINITY_DN38231_c0_g1~~TRINITY_DN38231_c0_g1_i1.p1  ORF type:complete len:645 (+),score=68.58 TRINITY_DN38231_c0_g1_i1:47-1936(+)